MIAVGLMCGTSLDGIDAALVDVVPNGDGYSATLQRFATVPLGALESRLRAAMPPHQPPADAIAALHRDTGRAFGEAAAQIAGGARVRFVASHGITLYHDGAAHTTMQIGDAFAIREAVRASVCYDFRSADCVTGGTGAPLVPFVDALLLGDAHEDRVALNVGGIANATFLPAGRPPDEAVAFDTGPGNMIVDNVMSRRTNGEERFDADGRRAMRGRVDSALLAACLTHPYFSQLPPKSAGREQFGDAFLAEHPSLNAMVLDDAIATATALTVETIARAVEARMPHARVLVSGGGVHNGAMLQGLAKRLPRAIVDSTAAVGVDPDAKEALAFAVLGYETLRGRPSNLPGVTGASHRVPLGAIAPYELRGLLEEMERECRLS